MDTEVKNRKKKSSNKANGNSNQSDVINDDVLKKKVAEKLKNVNAAAKRDAVSYE